MLTTDFNVIAYHRDIDFYLTVPNLAHIATDILDLRLTTLVLRHRASPTCALQLIDGNLQQIKKHCGYHLVLGPMPRGVFKLTERSLLFCNITSVTVRCRNNDTVETFTPEHTQIVYDQHCACQISADEFFIPEASLHCEQMDNFNLNFTPRFLVNLPYLTEFVGHHILEVLQDDTLLNQTISALLPKLGIASKEYDAKLAVKEAARFDLQAVINATKKDSYMYTKLSHFLYNNLLTTHPSRDV